MKKITLINGEEIIYDANYGNENIEGTLFGFKVIQIIIKNKGANEWEKQGKKIDVPFHSILKIEYL